MWFRCAGTEGPQEAAVERRPRTETTERDIMGQAYGSHPYRG